MGPRNAACCAAALWLLAAPLVEAAPFLSGYAAAELRIFPDEPLDDHQHGSNVSFSLAPELYKEWADGSQNLTFVPFVRWDQGDDERSHADIRELAWWKVAQDWELKVGIRKVFWGVTESQHLVDIVNQTDLVENPDGEEKLGQPMVDLALVREWGTVDLFVLPYFRERTFPGVEGRPNLQPPVDANNALYESDQEQWHTDFAVRWTKSIDIWDVGLSYFNGTSRDPRFIADIRPNGAAVLLPYYDIIAQVGVDVQATLGAWLWKLEAIRRSGQGDTFQALTAGFEYTLFGIADSSADLGLLTEYLYDSRGERAQSAFEDDVFLGARLTLNDEQSTELLVGGIADLSGDAVAYRLEGSRRIGAHFKLELEGRFYTGVEPDDLFYGLRRDGYWQVQLAYYF
jgi:hypothetical protein